MKKNIIIALLLAISNAAFAQAPLSIKNNTPCNLTATMWGNDPTDFDLCGDLISFPFAVGPFSGAVVNPWFTMPWATMTFFPSPGSPTFQWSRIDFSFVCGAACPPITGIMGDALISCGAPPAVWTGTSCAVTIKGSWNPVVGGYLNNVGIDFH